MRDQKHGRLLCKLSVRRRWRQRRWRHDTMAHAAREIVRLEAELQKEREYLARKWEHEHADRLERDHEIETDRFLGTAPDRVPLDTKPTNPYMFENVHEWRRNYLRKRKETAA